MIRGFFQGEDRSPRNQEDHTSTNERHILQAATPLAPAFLINDKEPIIPATTKNSEKKTWEYLRDGRKEKDAEQSLKT